MVHLTGIHIYPVKGLRGCALPAVEMDPLGLAGDRRFMVVDERGGFRSQRTLPRMALIGTALTAETLTLAAGGAGEIAVTRAPDRHATLLPVTVWASKNLPAEDCGEDAAAWLSDFLGEKCRLVRIGPAFRRPALKPDRARDGDALAFVDACPLLLISEASLAELNDRLVEKGGEPVPMNRFRPNLVVSGCPAFAEDDWNRLRIGSIPFRTGGPCGRCVVTTTDQETAERGLEPLRTLATYRRRANDPSEVDFGLNLFHETRSGRLQVGDVVEVDQV